MAFPVVASSNVTADTSSASITVAMPSGIVAGDLLVVIVAQDVTGTITQSGGSDWTKLEQTNDGASQCGLAIFAKIAAGGDTLTLTSTNSQDAAVVSLRITGHGVSNVSTDITRGTPATGSSATPDPPNCNQGTAKDYLWLEMFAADDDDDTATYWSTSFAAVAQQQSASSTSSCLVAVGQRNLNASAENPGTMAMAATEEWVAQTLAIPPSSLVAVTWLDTLTGTDTLTVSRAKNFNDTLTGTDSWILTKAKQFLDVLSGADTWNKEIFKTWLDTFSNTDEIIISKAKSFLDNLIGTDSWIIEKSKQFVDALSFVDEWFKTVIESLPPSPRPITSTGGLFRKPVPKIFEATVILPVKVKLVVHEKLPVKASIIESVKLSMIGKIQTLQQIAINATISLQNHLKIIGTISTIEKIKINGTLSAIIHVPITGIIKSSLEKITNILKIIDLTESANTQLRTMSFEFNEVLGAAGPLDDERELEFDEPSSFVGKVTYTPELQSLEIVLNGSIYHYCGLPQRIFDSFFGAESKGAFYNREIKGQYLC